MHYCNVKNTFIHILWRGLLLLTLHWNLFLCLFSDFNLAGFTFSLFRNLICLFLYMHCICIFNVFPLWIWVFPFLGITFFLSSICFLQVKGLAKNAFSAYFHELYLSTINICNVMAICIFYHFYGEVCGFNFTLKFFLCLLSDFNLEGYMLYMFVT